MSDLSTREGRAPAEAAGGEARSDRETHGLRDGGVFVLGLALLLGIVFGPHLDGEFISDDAVLVAQNASLQETRGLARIWGADLFRAAGAGPSDVYRPLPMTTFWAQTQLGARRMSSFRLLNVLLHGMVAFALFGALRRAGVSRGASSFAAWLFAVHPSVTEPTMWLSARPETLGLLFVAVSVWATAASAALASRLCLVFLASAAAFLCKESFAVLPVWLAVLQQAGAPARRAPRRWLPPVAAALLGVGSVAVLRATLKIATRSVQLEAGLGSTVRHLGTVLGHYGLQILTFENAATMAHYVAWSPVAASVAGAAFVALPVVLLVLDRRGVRHARAVAICVLLAFVALAPQVMALPVTETWANRYAYWALAAFMAAVAVVVDALAPWFPRAGKALGVVGLLVIAGAALLTAQEAATWRTSLTLYAAGVERAPQDARSLYHLGYAVMSREGCAPALPLFQKAWQIDPSYGRAAHNVAGCSINLGRWNDALAPARLAVAKDPEDPRNHYNLGVVLLALGSTREGLASLEKALAFAPGYLPAQRALENARANRQAEPPERRAGE